MTSSDDADHLPAEATSRLRPIARSVTSPSRLPSDCTWKLDVTSWPSEVIRTSAGLVCLPTIDSHQHFAAADQLRAGVGHGHKSEPPRRQPVSWRHGRSGRRREHERDHRDRRQTPQRASLALGVISQRTSSPSSAPPPEGTNLPHPHALGKQPNAPRQLTGTIDQQPVFRRADQTRQGELAAGGLRPAREESAGPRSGSRRSGAARAGTRPAPASRTGRPRQHLEDAHRRSRHASWRACHAGLSAQRTAASA